MDMEFQGTGARGMSGLDLERWRGHVPGLMGARAAYAVLAPVVCEPGKEPALLFEVRAGALRRQPGEVCFPGGKIEPGETPVQCALREAWEELGIPPSAVEVVGQTDFIAHQSGFLMYPVLGRVAGRGPECERKNAAEVAESFLVPVSFFEENPPEVWRYPLEPRIPEDFPYERVGISRDYPWRGGRADVPIYEYGGHVIWGLTARIVRHLFGHD